MERWWTLLVVLGLAQALHGASLEGGFEPMVAFICDRPAMHRGVNGWIPDANSNCKTGMQEILDYCRKVYPDHNITNVVEASKMTMIEHWPMKVAEREHRQRVRPWRCLAGGFQSDALLVPQHCEFDHRHDQRLCNGFPYWNEVAKEACQEKDMHLESLGMLLNCKLAMFSGVEFVCCPNQVKDTVRHPDPVVPHDTPDSWESEEDSDEDDEDYDDDDEEEDEEEDDEDYDDESDETSDEDDDEEDDEEEDSYDEDEDSYEDEDSSESESEDVDESENVIDFYEAYLRQQPFPAEYDNEHKRFLAAKEWMKKHQRQKTTKLLQQWQAAREDLEATKFNEPGRYEQMSEQIAKRFQNLYASYQQEDEAEKQQLLAVHQQHIQSLLNERKRDSMDSFMKALDNGDEDQIIRHLQGYIKAEEKDRMHTVNHFEHIKYSNAHEALRIHPFIVNHLKLSEQRIDQALQLLSRYPDIERDIRPEIDEFMHRFDAIANSIRNVVLPVPEVEEDETSSEELPEPVDLNTLADPEDDLSSSQDISDEASQEESLDQDGDDIREDEHDFEHDDHFVAHAMDDSMSASKGSLHSSHATVQSSQLGSTLGIALGGVSVFVIIVVAIVMVHRNNRPRNDYNPGGYVESPQFDDEEQVDPSASPEERHVANMQMNGYENPTYKYFEVQSNPKA